ncbi:hypothetical protein ANN_20801 [Periplaneta americana]|uniref:Reverse transcriptase n=1 Tax=Periplaneta americana TaxID=6978 RepID=A0ABQ8SED7_PERAM|nr:hypothetical protein ANN_20801 [Periplaneta americana]
MTANVSAVRVIPVRSQDNHCRRCLSEIETLGHVLGACPHGETLRIHRHHAIRTKLADALIKLKYTVNEEVHGTADNGSNRPTDIIAINESLSQVPDKSGVVVDYMETTSGLYEVVRRDTKTESDEILKYKQHQNLVSILPIIEPLNQIPTQHNVPEEKKTYSTERNIDAVR